MRGCSSRCASIPATGRRTWHATSAVNRVSYGLGATVKVKARPLTVGDCVCCGAPCIKDLRARCIHSANRGSSGQCRRCKRCVRAPILGPAFDHVGRPRVRRMRCGWGCGVWLASHEMRGHFTSLARSLLRLKCARGPDHIGRVQQFQRADSFGNTLQSDSLDGRGVIQGGSLKSSLKGTCC